MIKNSLNFRVFIAGLLFVMTTSFGMAREVVEMESAQIKGDQEQPKVLYVIPWQETVDDQRFKQPIESLIGEIFEPLDRNAFLNEFRIHNAMKQGRSSRL